ncbi:hypothetical protein, partial [Enterococcus faecium]
DANPPARKKVGEAVKRGLLHAFAKDAAAGARSLLEQARASGKAETGALRLAGQGGEASVTASHFKQQGGSFFLVRLASKAAAQVDL